MNTHIQLKRWTSFSMKKILKQPNKNTIFNKCPEYHKQIYLHTYIDYKWKQCKVYQMKAKIFKWKMYFQSK